jgi:hypothetical protein
VLFRRLNEGMKSIAKIRHDVKSFVDKVNFVTPLETREAFAGGRTEAFKVYHEAKGNEAINYYDMTSL